MPPTCPTALQDERFLLLCALGRGGMARVYRAFDRIEQRVVALKVLRDPSPLEPTHPLAAEYRAWTRLRHPNIVQAFELVGAARRGPFPRGAPYLVLEHVEGPSLDQGLRGGLAPQSLERIGRQLLHGLRHVHDCGLVHRDVKPSNVLIAGRLGAPRYKLTDFGLAVACGESEEPGRLSGSLPYVAPESFLGHEVDSRADLYGLGILLFRLATGRLPVTPRSVNDLLRWHLAGPPADPRRVQPHFPPRLARFIRRLTARDPSERPRDAAEALACLGGCDDPAGPVRPTPVRDLATRAALRFALDSTRLGARRRFRLSPGSDAPRIGPQLRGWAHGFGLAFHDLRGPAGSAPPLLRAVLRSLLDLGDEAHELVQRFELGRCLPLACVGGVPLVDRSRYDLAPPGDAAARVADFLFARADLGGLVLLASTTGGSCRLTRRVVGLLSRRLARPQPPHAGRRGLLLVLEAD